ncbi:DUF177 domain-containing protein [Hydrogenibacillus sp. N12]|uniref:YceD family protein n=1 Tax=Hydrogenibacillus sp. N12 TaxID=2866627 RepID=UPI001C7D2BA6|nr:DUF177 domain-containing protein [Hydrogenibacillus sp. N12]QZA33450.1 DUF177 domain-containing protein [Hydrogenibacillus sp. N12]
MRLSFSEARQAAGRPVRLAGAVPARRPVAIREVLELSPLHFDGEARWADGEVRLTGALSYRARLTCVRCLKPFTAEFHVDVEERFRPAEAALAYDPPAIGRLRGSSRREQRSRAGGEAEATKAADADPGVEVVAKAEIDVGRVLQDLAIVHLPWAPICRPDCAGLCPTCGKDLNEGPCGCEPETIDPRWLALRTLWDGRK